MHCRFWSPAFALLAVFSLSGVAAAQTVTFISRAGGAAATKITAPIVVDTLSWEVKTTVAVGGAAGGAGAGKASFGAVTFTKNVDAASPMLFSAVGVGVPYESVKVTKGDVTYTFGVVFVSSVKSSVSKTGEPKEDVTLAVGSAQVEYKGAKAAWSQITNTPTLAK